MRLTVDEILNMPTPNLDANYEAAKERVVSDRNREALRRLDPLLEYAVEHAARRLLEDALTWKELHPDKPYLWRTDEEFARRIIDNRADGPALVERSEVWAKSRAEYLRELAESTGCDMFLRPVP